MFIQLRWTLTRQQKPVLLRNMAEFVTSGFAKSLSGIYHAEEEIFNNPYNFRGKFFFKLREPVSNPDNFMNITCSF